MIPLELVGVRVELPANQPIVLLRDPDSGRYLPIWIGGAEAMSISSHLEGDVPPRPLTHQLLADTLRALGAELEAVHLTDLREGTFYAELHLLSAGQEVVVSARPSDAIAVAIRLGAIPILVRRGAVRQGRHRAGRRGRRQFGRRLRRPGGRGPALPGLPRGSRSGRLPRRLTLRSRSTLWVDTAV